MQTDGRIDRCKNITKVMHAFRNYVNAPKNEEYDVYLPDLRI
jgi:hypothetical protein